MEQQEYEMVPVLYVSIAGSGLICYATGQALGILNLTNNVFEDRNISKLCSDHSV